MYSKDTTLSYFKNIFSELKGERYLQKRYHSYATTCVHVYSSTGYVHTLIVPCNKIFSMAP